MKPEPITTTTTVFQCPACRYDVRAAVRIEPNLSAPQLKGLGEVTINVSPVIKGLAVIHVCGGAEVPPEADTAEEQGS